MAEIRGCLFPEDLLYDQDLNIWFRQIHPQMLEVGLTPFGLAMSGEVYMFNPKPDGREIEFGRAFALIEVAKTILPVRVPFACTVVSSNSSVVKSPDLIGRAPYSAWLARLSTTNDDMLQSLISIVALPSRAHALMDAHGFTSLETYLNRRQSC